MHFDTSVLFHCLERFLPKMTSMKYGLIRHHKLFDCFNGSGVASETLYY